MFQQEYSIIDSSRSPLNLTGQFAWFTTRISNAQPEASEVDTALARTNEYVRSVNVDEMSSTVAYLPSHLLRTW